MVNPFQQGQTFENTRRAAALKNQAEQSRQQGVNALAAEFGERALAPAEFATVTGADRAERGFVAKEEQRGLTNERTARLDEISAEERQRKNMISGLGQIVGGIKAGIKGGAPIEDVIKRFGPVLQNAFGVTEEELLALPQSIADNPGLLDDIEGALRINSKRKAIGVPVTIRMPDGTQETRQRYNDGTFDVLGGVDVGALSAQSRATTAARNAASAAAKVDPSKVGAVASAKELGKLTAKGVQEQFGTMMDTARGISQARFAIGLLDKGIRTGSFAETRQGISRFFGDFFGLEDAAIQPTDEFVAIQGAALADLLATGAFGAGTGVSDNDVRFAKNIVAGNVGLDHRALRRIINIQISKSEAKIAQYNRSRDAVIKRNPDFAGDFPPIKVPAVQEAAALGEALEFETGATIDALLDKYR